ncbi:class E sortase [Phytoactinopolyspora alkaliphila]|uniref:Class E sortase n=1 Tax=Phytoactinopolyspora alkaliphila TaxID=1783498 RepID=A0A6N9YRV0_9ACTN|nr:class E sortase [Phytoactinopolyspora alkaliphila]NED97670.1 class E sortase [Phytoactinopolyspora alkaliphila]
MTMREQAETGQPRSGARVRGTPPRRSVPAMIAGGFGELLLTAGALVLLFVVYLLWGTGLQTAAAQDDLRGQLDLGGSASSSQDGSSPDESDSSSDRSLDELALGDAYGIIRIPRFGDDWEWVIVQGVEDDDLRNGPGHYPDSANPGELGNFAVAAHRSGHGEPFAPFPRLHVGDIVEIETVDGTFVYKLDDAPDGDSDGNRISISDSWVVDPVPGQPRDAEPVEKRITLTTCWPRFGSSHRMYATGVLIEEEQR